MNSHLLHNKPKAANEAENQIYLNLQNQIYLNKNLQVAYIHMHVLFFFILNTDLTFLTFLHIGDEEMEAQKASKQNKLMKTKTFPNNYQFKYLEKHKRKTKLH